MIITIIMIIIILIIMMIIIIYIYIYYVYKYRKEVQGLSSACLFSCMPDMMLLLFIALFLFYVQLLCISTFLYICVLTILLQFYICQILLCCMCVTYLYFSFLICIHLFIEGNCVKYIDIGLSFLYTIRYLVKHQWLKIKHV